MAIYALADPVQLRWSVWSLFNLQYSCCPMILLVLIPIVALTDPERSQTDFLHWTGVITMVASSLLNGLFRWLVIYWR